MVLNTRSYVHSAQTNSNKRKKKEEKAEKAEKEEKENFTDAKHVDFCLNNSL